MFVGGGWWWVLLGFLRLVFLLVEEVVLSSWLVHTVGGDDDGGGRGADSFDWRRLPTVRTLASASVQLLLGGFEHAPFGCFVGLRTYACLTACTAA